jgi:PhzF family phenazine biosynthesis protein
MRIPIYQIDAFASRPFAGNPAAVMPLGAWLPDERLQAIAAENNLSETAFLVPEGEGWHIRWFTPMSEVDLCGHATLASAFVILTELRPDLDAVRFHSASGLLAVSRQGDRFCLDFPSRPPVQVAAPAGLEAALGAPVLETWQSRDLVAVLDSEATVRDLAPDFSALARIDAFAIGVTARGETCDFVSRFFVPREGIPEDPVTGSLHSTLIPFWAARLGRDRMEARQLSHRGGELSCELKGDRVAIAGRAVKVLQGEMILPD